MTWVHRFTSDCWGAKHWRWYNLVRWLPPEAGYTAIIIGCGGFVPGAALPAQPALLPPPPAAAHSAPLAPPIPDLRPMLPLFPSAPYPPYFGDFGFGFGPSGGAPGPVEFAPTGTRHNRRLRAHRIDQMPPPIVPVSGPKMSAPPLTLLPSPPVEAPPFTTMPPIELTDAPPEITRVPEPSGWVAFAVGALSLLGVSIHGRGIRIP